jgi:spore coat polysaccharide biosynthesis protein SpsF (cytidylyltransferase family)
MTTAVVVQARMGSSRLPGKVLMDIAGRTALAHVLRRCALIPGADVVVCATTPAASDDPVATAAASLGAAVFRGSETDVLDRYLGAARMVDANVVLRVTSDCPLIDPDVCGRVLALQQSTGAALVTNNRPPSWPHGLDCEAISREGLEASAANAADPFEREHVSPWLRRHPEWPSADLPGPGGELPECRWTLDYPEDLQFFRAIFPHLGAEPDAARMADVLAVLARHPELAEINRMRHQR